MLGTRGGIIVVCVGGGIEELLGPGITNVEVVLVLFVSGFPGWSSEPNPGGDVCCSMITRLVRNWCVGPTVVDTSYLGGDEAVLGGK